MRKIRLPERAFLVQIFALALPMALNNLINTAVMTADTMMLGRVGEKVLSGASLGGQIYFILSLFLFGSCSGASVLMAQYWGKHDMTSLEKIMGIALRITMSISLLFMAVTLIMPETLMRIYTHDPEVIEQGVRYLRIIAFTYPVTAFTSTYLMLIRNIERVTISTVVYTLSLFVNIGGNAVLIFGLLGFPALGIRGAAAATLIARLFELTITVWYARFRNDDLKVRLRYILHADPLLWKDFLTYSIYVIINELLWGTGISATSAVMGHLGSDVVAAQSVADSVRQLAMVVCFGLANATAIIVGKEIGRDDIRRAERYASDLLVISVIFGFLGTVLVLLIRPFIFSLVHFEAETLGYLRFFLICMAVYTIPGSVDTTVIVGILRAGGDTKAGLYIDTGFLWGCAVLLGALTAFVLKLPVKVVYLFLISDEFLKAPVAYWRYRKKIWLRNVTRDLSGEDALP